MTDQRLDEKGRLVFKGLPLGESMIVPLPKGQINQDERGRFLPRNEMRLEHGAYLYLKNGKLSLTLKGRRRIQKSLAALRQRLVEVVPDSQDPRKECLINQICRSEGYLLLAEAHLQKFGLCQGDKLKRGKLEAQPLTMYIVSMMNCQTRAISALGLDKREAESILTIEELGHKIEAEGSRTEGKNEDHGRH